MIGERAADRLGIAHLDGIDIADNRHAGLDHVRVGQSGGKRLVGGLHQARVEGPGDGEFHRLPRAVFLREGDGHDDFRSLAREDDLPRSVDIGDIHIGGGGEFADAVLLSADDGGHSAVGSLAGLLHGAGALVHEAKSGFKIKSPRSGVGGEFTQRQAGGGVELERGELFLQHREAGESVDIQSRLANRGFGQLLGRSLERDTAEWIPKNRVGFFEQRGGGGKFGGEVLAHANGLGALAGEEKCGFFHREMGFNAIRRGCSCRPAGCQ